MNTKLATSLRVSPQIRSRGRFVLGAAIGTGMAARAAERGGADFLLALTAGAFRSMGAPSAACMLALRDCNRFVMEFGQREILTRTALPVFFGAAAFGGEDHGELINAIDVAGFRGVANFPSCIFLDGRFREYLEESSRGFERELQLLRAAKAGGLAALAYVSTPQEARRAALAGVDIVNVSFGWNVGGAVGATTALGLQEATTLAGECVAAVRAVDRDIQCLVEGGPIVTPEQMDEVCRLARADGYIGGSTIDRVPLESAIEMATEAFKTIGTLRKQVDTLKGQLNRRGTVDALIGLGEAVTRARDQVASAMESDLPVLIVGEPGTGRNEVARAIHESRVRPGRLLVAAECSADVEQEFDIDLFGCAAGISSRTASARTGLLDAARGSTLVLEEIGNLPLAVQRQLMQAVRNGSFWPRGSTQVLPLEVRIIGVSRLDPLGAAHAERFDPQFASWLNAIRIDLPPLRERLEDLPMLAEMMLRKASKGERRRLDPSAYRLLLSHQWSDNLRELRSVLQKAALGPRSKAINDRELLASMKPSAATQPRKTFATEREWILDGLKRNRFRRAETAHFLRISRKTLYNKMRHYSLLTPGGERIGDAERPTAE